MSASSAVVTPLAEALRVAALALLPLGDSGRVPSLAPSTAPGAAAVWWREITRATGLDSSAL